MKKTAVVAIGGNSLITSKEKIALEFQLQNVQQTCRYIAGLILRGWNVVITHGNGPQVGFLLRRAELAVSELPLIPLDIIGADTQGAIGYMIQQSLYNEFKERNIKRKAVTLVTQVLVDKNSKAFQSPSKPIGGFMDEETAALKASEEGWQVVEDAGRGWRRVVPSPEPMEILEKEAIIDLIDNGYIIVCVGGGGIPVIRNDDGSLSGVAAVIDKDYASALLAGIICADLFIISTAVEKVALNFGRQDQKDLDCLTLEEAKRYSAEGHFAAGSMGPKIDAMIKFLESGGKEGLITSPAKIEEALDGKTGTRFIRA